MKSDKAVLYLRSSKDRADVSIDAQRRTLHELAAARSLTVVAEFVDVVESGKDEDRPGLQALYEALRDRARAWQTILVLDTSRLMRRIAAAYWFEDREAKPRGVEVVYRNLPEMDVAERALVKAVFHGVDEWHSLVSKRKGLAGMRENVRQGWRAGGRAPHGYRLRREPTGAIRDGQPVMKSRLEPGPAAPAIAAYLKLRAGGMPMSSAVRETGLDLAASTLNSLEWNALTYAGCTVWNVHNELVRGHYQSGTKRRPRAEWVIREDTHEPLITRTEAEALLLALEAKRDVVRRRYRTAATYLLTGILHDPAGKPWHGTRDGPGRLYYRAGNVCIRNEKVDRAVIGQIAADLRSPAFTQRMLRACRRLAEPDIEADAIARAYAGIEDLDRKIASLMASLTETTAKRPLLAQIEKWEQEREKIRAGIVGLETKLATARAAGAITERDIERIADRLAADLDKLDREALKDFLQGMIDRITLDPVTRACKINYVIQLKREVPCESRASPRPFGEIPRVALQTLLRLAA